jgi:uncharacterized protein YkwD
MWPGLASRCSIANMRQILLALMLMMANGARAEDGFQQQILAVHNAERARLGLPFLHWNPALAADAETWAWHLAAIARLEHDRPDHEGENLWRGTAGAFGVADMVGSWIAEKQDFKQGKFPDVSKSGEWHAVGHYTQVIWRRTAAVGCAMAGAGNWDYLVCRYGPPGNVIGQKPY